MKTSPHTTASTMTGVNVSDVVLAYHGAMIYAAKVLKIEERAKTSAPDSTKLVYFVHYLGWNRSWDEWIGSERLMENTVTNRELQARINAAAKQAEISKKDSLKRKEVIQKTDFRTKLRKCDYTMEMEEYDSSEFQICLNIPFALKKCLVEDWERITREPQQLLPLPREHTVQKVLQTYLDQRKIKGGAGAPNAKVVRNLQEFADALQMYFDKALGSILLYRSERIQYEVLLQQYPNVLASKLYGAEHLLRLFVRLPYLLSQTTLDEAFTNQIQFASEDFMGYLFAQQDLYFPRDYIESIDHHLVG